MKEPERRERGMGRDQVSAAAQGTLVLGEVSQPEARSERHRLPGQIHTAAWASQWDSSC